jgi:hypothetical protein
LEQCFCDPAGGYFLSAHDGERLIAREKPFADGAEPSGNAVAALDLLRLAELTGEPAWRASALAAIEAFAGRLDGEDTPAMLAAVDFASDEPLELVLVAPRGGDARALLAVVRRAYLPNSVLVMATEGEDLTEKARLVPLLERRGAARGRATAYVCRGTVCDLPTGDPAALAAQLARRPARRGEGAEGAARGRREETGGSP